MEHRPEHTSLIHLTVLARQHWRRCSTGEMRCLSKLTQITLKRRAPDLRDDDCIGIVTTFLTSYWRHSCGVSLEPSPHWPCRRKSASMQSLRVKVEIGASPNGWPSPAILARKSNAEVTAATGYRSVSMGCICRHSIPWQGATGHLVPFPLVFPIALICRNSDRFD